MSQVLEKSPKHCADKRGILIQINKKKVFYTSLLTSTILSLILFIFILYLILHPSSPDFSLRQADFLRFNLSSSTAVVDLFLITSSLQVSFDSRNPNQKVGIYYDQLRAYASYRGQQITSQTQLPSFYQPNNNQQQLDHVNFLSVTLSGYALPVATDIVYESARKLILTVTLDGRLRWKIGSWVSIGHRVQVNCLCLAVVPILNYPSAGLRTAITTAMGSEPEFAAHQQGSQCSTSII